MKNKNISNEKMKIILEEISSPDGKYFGGVTAYLCAEFALALLEKLNFRIARKNDENSSFFFIQHNYLYNYASTKIILP